MNLQRLRSVLGKGNQHLGDIVFWQLADARVDRTTLESLWRDAGLDAALLPEEPTAERALKQAVREAQVGQRDRLIRLGLDSEAEIVFAIVRDRYRHEFRHAARDMPTKVRHDRFGAPGGDHVRQFAFRLAKTRGKLPAQGKDRRIISHPASSS